MRFQIAWEIKFNLSMDVLVMSDNDFLSFIPFQLYRADLISAMKLPDSYPMELGSFLTIREPWRSEWDSGVQVLYYCTLLCCTSTVLLCSNRCTPAPPLFFFTS